MGMLGVAGRVALAKTKTSSADTIPNAVNWPDVSQVVPPFSVDTISQTISGINTTIELEVTIDFNDGALYYIKNADAPVSAGIAPFTVVNGDTLKFRFQGSGGVVQFNVYNNSDPSGPTLLDTCFMEVTF